jgi:nicotinate-nucleotide pyrophosphorylase (carboxylating)
MSGRAVDTASVTRAVAAALAEDLGARGDVTTRAVVPTDRRGKATFVAREAMVVAGLDVAREVFRQLNPSVTFTAHVADGALAGAGTSVASAVGPARALLEGERTALNFLQRMSGIATAAHAAVEEIAGTGATILDTRKTAPGLRALDKYAVAAGGGTNHRMGLHDAAMIKDTHLGVAASLASAIAACRAAGLPREAITAEVRSVDELEEAIAAGAGRALLDNMTLQTTAECVRRAKGKILLEASGGLRPGGLRAVAQAGVDFLSLGYLTHSVRAADLAMDLSALP